MPLYRLLQYDAQILKSIKLYVTNFQERKHELLKCMSYGHLTNTN